MQHGPRLTLREYEGAIVSLYSGLPLTASEAELGRVRRRELDLTIDYRLGKDFPSERRELLWQVQQRIEKRRLQLAAYWLVGRFVPRWLHRRANRVAKFVVDEYAKVLTRDELQAYFGEDEVENPSLPDDRH
jgi:hypothetical protein